MSVKFEVSDDFAMYEQQTTTAAAEAGKQEKMAMGINMPVGTKGMAALIEIKAGKSKVKTDPKTKQQTGGHPMITLTAMVKTPENFIGQKCSLYFTLNQTETQSVQQKYQRLYDALEDMGMPRELRGKPMKEIAAWAGAEERCFQFEIAQHWQNKDEKEFKPQGSPGKVPSSTDIESHMPTTYSVDQQVLVAGSAATVLEVNGDKCKVKFANGQEMEVNQDSVQPVPAE